MSNRLFFSIGLMVFIAGICCNCDSSEPENFEVDFGYEYFPLDVGIFRIYEVDSIIYDPAINGTRVDSSTTLIRDLIAEALTDETGQMQFRVERSERKSEAEPWRNTKTFTLAREERRALWTEDNLRFVKMPFPLKTGARWNGNAFFDPLVIIPVAGESIQMFKDWESEVIGIGESAQVGDLSFSDVTTIRLADSQNLIELRQATERYARDVGLIYREYSILDTQCEVCCRGDFGACGELPWEEKAEKGFIMRQRLIEFN